MNIANNAFWKHKQAATIISTAYTKSSDYESPCKFQPAMCSDVLYSKR
jgi:hypothetical protein